MGSPTHFRFTVPGELPTVNHSYAIVRRRDTGRMTLAKTKGLEAWQATVTAITRAARPTGFDPAGFVVVAYEFYLDSRRDADNAMKALNDAIALGLGINDNRFLPVALMKHKAKEPSTVVYVYDAAHWRTSVLPV